MDKDTRDYFFELMRNMSDRSRDYVLVSLFGYLEGLSFSDPDHFEFLTAKIQLHSDIDHGVNNDQ
jgi:hypothetical protein